MTSGIDFNYGQLPYQYPLVDSQPVIRIPLAGPPPYNTLVIVRGREWGEYYYADGDVHRWTSVTPTNFHLAEYDERVGTPPPQHSTTVCLQLAEFTKDCEFLIANDVVSGYFDAGVWTVQVDVAAESDDKAVGAWGYYYSSWVLCYEPPVKNMPPGAPWPAKGRVIPNHGFLLPAPRQPGDRRSIKRPSGTTPC
jgi:hypothetical protein